MRTELIVKTHSLNYKLLKIPTTSASGQGAGERQLDPLHAPLHPVGVPGDVQADGRVPRAVHTQRALLHAWPRRRHPAGLLWQGDRAGDCLPQPCGVGLKSIRAVCMVIFAAPQRRALDCCLPKVLPWMSWTQAGCLRRPLCSVLSSELPVMIRWAPEVAAAELAASEGRADRAPGVVSLLRPVHAVCISCWCRAQENLRQLCVFNLGSKAGRPWVWWDYTTRFSEECSMEANRYGQVRPASRQAPWHRGAAHGHLARCRGVAPASRQLVAVLPPACWSLAGWQRRAACAWSCPLHVGCTGHGATCMACHPLEELRALGCSVSICGCQEVQLHAAYFEVACFRTWACSLTSQNPLGCTPSLMACLGQCADAEPQQVVSFATRLSSVHARRSARSRYSRRWAAASGPACRPCATASAT